MTITLEEFQAEAQKRGVSKGRRPQPYNAEQRAFAVEYAKEQRSLGKSKAAILRELGICDGTLWKWSNTDTGTKTPRRFRRVSLSRGEGGGLCLVTPSGYRIEGLDLESVSTLLKSLR